MPARIAVFGAPGTGKTTLCHELARHLRTCGHRVRVVTPGQTEAAQVDDLVIEDSPPWPDAPSGGDAPSALPAPAPEGLRRYDLTLLMGLDLPEPANLRACQGVDARLRDALTRAGAGWRVVYGVGPERVEQALQAVAAALPWAWQVRAREEDIGRWSRLRASCEKCGDADCEHRLFTGGALRPADPTAPPT